MLHPDETIEAAEEASENAPPFVARNMATAAVTTIGSYGASNGSSKDGINTTYASTLPSPPTTHANINKATNAEGIFRDSYTIDNRVRTPLYPMPRHYQSQQHQNQQQLPRSTRAETTTDSQRPKIHRRESLDNMPIDSDTLLPISSDDQESLITSATVPAPHVLISQQQQQQSYQQHPFDLASAITTSPTLLFTDEEEDDHRPNLANPVYPMADEMTQSGWISTRSSKSELFGEDIMSVGTSRASIGSRSVLPSPVEQDSNNQDERYSYSPSASEFHDVELQATYDHDHQRLRHSFTNTSTSSSQGDVLNHLPAIGGPPTMREKVTRQQQLKAAMVPPAAVSKLIHQVGEWTQKEIAPVARTAKQKATRLIHHYRGPPPSPHTKNMADLNYLRNAHRAKVDKLSDIEHEDHFDFALVLTSQEVYSYWSDLLDFRVEQLGEDAAQAINDATTLVSEYGSVIAPELSPRPSLETVPSSSSDGTSPERPSELEVTASNDGTPPALHNFSTPATGMYRRRNRVHSVDSSAVPMALTTPEATSFFTAPHSRVRTLSLASPYRIATSSHKSVVPRMSLFERALGPVAVTPCNQSSDGNGFHQPLDGMYSDSKPDATPNTVVSTNRRRWGPHSLNRALQTPNCMMSPPIRSLSHGGSSSVLPKRTAATLHRTSTANIPVPEERDGDEEASILNQDDPNILRIEAIPSHVIPRGIAARTNGMLQFLSALKRGIVVRRHRSGLEPVFCKIASNDGGDTISFEYVETEDAMNAFKEQRVRYNRNSAGNAVTSRSIAQPWSYIEESDEESVFQNHNFSVPDFIAAKQFREKMQREQGMARKVTDAVAKVTRSGQFRASDMVAVHPARHDDPRSDKGELGTSSLRRSKAEHSTLHTFSVVCRVVKRLPGATSKAIESFENKW